MTKRKLNLVTPCSQMWRNSEKAFILAFGAYGTTLCLTYAQSLEDALEDCAQWLSEHAPGYLTPYGETEHMELIQEACQEMGLEYPLPDNWQDDRRYIEAAQTAEADLTYTESGFLTSYEWNIVGEGLSPKEISDFAHGR